MAEIKDFTCRACGAQFDTRETLDRHQRREHGVQGKESSRESGTQRGGQQDRVNEPGSSSGSQRADESGWDEG
jgi:hypothetical protein